MADGGVYRGTFPAVDDGVNDLVARQMRPVQPPGSAIRFRCRQEQPLAGADDQDEPRLSEGVRHRQGQARMLIIVHSPVT